MNDPLINKYVEEMEKSTNAEVRDQLAERIVARTHELQPYVWLYHTTSFTLYQPWLRDITWHQMFNADKLVNVWIDQSAKK